MSSDARLGIPFKWGSRTATTTLRRAEDYVRARSLTAGGKYGPGRSSARRKLGDVRLDCPDVSKLDR